MKTYNTLIKFIDSLEIGEHFDNKDIPGKPKRFSTDINLLFSYLIIIGVIEITYVDEATPLSYKRFYTKVDTVPFVQYLTLDKLQIIANDKNKYKLFIRECKIKELKTDLN